MSQLLYPAVSQVINQICWQGKVKEPEKSWREKLESADSTIPKPNGCGPAQLFWGHNSEIKQTVADGIWLLNRVSNFVGLRATELFDVRQFEPLLFDLHSKVQWRTWKWGKAESKTKHPLSSSLPLTGWERATSKLLSGLFWMHIKHIMSPNIWWTNERKPKRVMAFALMSGQDTILLTGFKRKEIFGSFSWSLGISYNRSDDDMSSIMWGFVAAV